MQISTVALKLLYVLSANPLFTGKERVIKERFFNPNIIFHNVIDFQFFNLFHTLASFKNFKIIFNGTLQSSYILFCYNMLQYEHFIL